ncbi:allatotropins-like [Cydia pomonella]|uniref:allatotropins-like n=1 Tax=Cydia pomonella TaxID=82600 RepID=UPI002ADDDF80|nr:allatotropins-like [Cydia pomonella]
MSIPMQLLLVVAAFCVLSDGAPDTRIARAKQQRPTRGFKNLEMMTARGFGKRGRVSTRSERDVSGQTPPERTYRATPTYKSPAQHYARDFGKRTPEMEQEDRESEEPRRFNPKNLMMVARSFGKRSDETAEEEEEKRQRRTDFKPDNKINVAVGYGKRKMPNKRVYGLDNFWETLAAPEREGQEMEDDKLESIPLDWFVNEIVNNPDFARSVVRKFVDINQDGVLSSDELLRNV